MFLIKLITSICLFLLSGVASLYLYVEFRGSGGAFFPGMLYTSATILVFIINKRINDAKQLLIYLLLMYLTYIIIFYVTFITFYFSFFVGIITAGVGAWATFIVTDKYIVSIKFNNWHIFLLGGLAFVITDILHFIAINKFDTNFVSLIFKVDDRFNTFYADVFIFWQLIVGIKLFLTTRKL